MQEQGTLGRYRRGDDTRRPAENTDWNDVVSEIGVHDAKRLFHDQWEHRHKKVEKPSTAFTLRRIGDIPLTEPEFRRRPLGNGHVGALLRRKRMPKTFAVFDLAASIATGAPYAGRQTKEGTVIYLAGEGTGGLPRRAKAWEMHRGISRKTHRSILRAGRLFSWTKTEQRTLRAR